jgi:tetratricopeptide (TPR) repeat protein
MSVGQAQSSSPQQALQQYISDLQKNPNDTVLREKIIRHVQQMRPAPALPPETIKYEGRAEAAVQYAKTPKDYLDAAAEYKKALLIAPWVASYYFNLGVVLEKASNPAEAIKNFKLYLLAAPNVRDTVEVQKKIAGLEYQVEKATIDAQKPKFPSPQDLTGHWRTESHTDPNLVTADGGWLLFKCFENACATSGAIIKFRLDQYEMAGTFRSLGGIRGSKDLSREEIGNISCLNHLKSLGAMAQRTIAVKGTVSKDWKTLTFRWMDQVQISGCALGYEELEVVYYR